VTDELPPGGCRGQGKFETWDLSGMKNGAVDSKGAGDRELLVALVRREATMAAGPARM
jgi:hypothetical protein